MAGSQIVTVTGPISVQEAGLTDGHNHVWIDTVAGADPDAPVLNDYDAILAELKDYAEAGGRTQVDCQPGGCGRNGNQLRLLSQASGVQIVACTGFHLRKYYPTDFWLWSADSDTIAEHFVAELQRGLSEAADICAGFIKIACEREVRLVPDALWEAAARASLLTGAAIEVHTEQGVAAEQIVAKLQSYGLPVTRLVLCHMDKRPDLALHRDLAGEGVMLEYDTFFRSKYAPDTHAWRLLEQMLRYDLSGQLVFATDMAFAHMWQHLGGSPGLTAYIRQLNPRLKRIGCSVETIARLMGGNIAQRLARQSIEPVA